MKYERVEFKSECECGGTICGEGWSIVSALDDSGEIVKFLYQECNDCGWNQVS